MAIGRSVTERIVSIISLSLSLPSFTINILNRSAHSFVLARTTSGVSIPIVKVVGAPWHKIWGLNKKNVTSAWDNKGDIIIDNDVWIGYEAVIMAGVHIGDGVVIAALAVVTKDVPPYTIVGGTSARKIRMRFEEETIAKLQQIQWWNWPVEKIRQSLPYIMNGTVDRLT